MTTRTVSLDRFKDAAGFIPQFHRWGNQRKGNVSKITTSNDEAQDAKTKERVSLRKQLIVAKEYDAVLSFMGELQKWVYRNTVPSFFKAGFQLVGLSGVDTIEQRMRKAQGELAVLVSNLVNVFPARVEESKTALGEQFLQDDYPGLDELRRMFSIEWNWVAFTVPEGLPEELKAAEADKLQKQFADAGEQILQALRTGFSELINNGVEKLTPKEGEGKAKQIRDSLIGNVIEFLDAFNQRNIVNDVEMAQLVARARTVLVGVTPQKLRDNGDIKENTRKAFEGIKTDLDKMIAERPAREFDFEAGEEPATATEPAQVAA